MKNKNKIFVIFLLILMSLTSYCYATAAYFYANKYKVNILNASEYDIERIDVLAPINESREEVPGVEYEYVSRKLYNYGIENVEHTIKCFKYENVKKLKFKDNICIVEICDINNFLQKNKELYFGGDMILKIVKTNGDVVYTETFFYTAVVSPESSKEERENAKLQYRRTGIFECDLESEDELLEVKLVESSNEDYRNYLIKNVVIIAVTVILIATIIIGIKRKVKNKNNK